MAKRISKKKKKPGPLYRMPAQGSASQAKCKPVVRGQGPSKAVSVMPVGDDMAEMIQRLEAKLNPPANAVKVK